MKLATPSAALLLLLLSASAVQAEQVAAIPRPGSATVVTSDELAHSNRHNVYDFLRANRPLWLRARGSSGVGSTTVMAYLDGHLLGPAAELRGIPTAIVTQVRFLDGREATTRFGANHGNGAIMVITGPPPAITTEGAAPIG